jgi:RHS repeat-associated protein
LALALFVPFVFFVVPVKAEGNADHLCRVERTGWQRSGSARKNKWLRRLNAGAQFPRKTLSNLSLRRASPFSFRELTQTSALNGTTTWAYDLAGNNTSITDPVSNRTVMAYDKDGRLTSETNPMGYTATSSYDLDGRLTSSTDANGRQSNFGYDNAGERTSETWLNSSQQVIYTANFGYDAAGQLTSESDGNSSYANTHDAGGRLTQQVVTYPGLSGSPLVTLTSSYNGFNDRTGFSDSLGGTATFGFDGDHQLTSAQLTASGVGANVALTYDSLNRLSTTTRTLVGRTGGHTITGTNTYDTAGRLTGLLYRDTTSNTQLANYTYGYDAANDVTSYTGPEGNLTYTYDHTLQLTAASGTVNGQPYSASYTYDLNGNRTMTGYQTGTGNELLNDGSNSYTYDHAGNMLTKTDSSGNVWTYTWNYHNRLTEVVEKNTSQQVLQDEKFTFDVEDRLIQVTSLGVTQRWTVYDGANPYMDLNASGQATMRYLTNPQGLSQFFARADPSGNVGWYLTDRLGSVRQVVSASASILDQLTYDVYGSILSETNSANGDRFKFASGEFDPVQATYRFSARWYGPASGRFETQDPLGLGGGDANLFRYAQNNPADLVDPSGLAADVRITTTDDEQALKFKDLMQGTTHKFSFHINVGGIKEGVVFEELTRHAAGFPLPPKAYMLAEDAGAMGVWVGGLPPGHHDMEVHVKVHAKAVNTARTDEVKDVIWYRNPTERWFTVQFLGPRDYTTPPITKIIPFVVRDQWTWTLILTTQPTIEITPAGGQTSIDEKISVEKID